jgi:hypothetical protein
MSLDFCNHGPRSFNREGELRLPTSSGHELRSIESTGYGSLGGSKESMILKMNLDDPSYRIFGSPTIEGYLAVNHHYHYYYRLKPTTKLKIPLQELASIHSIYLARSRG